LGRTDIKNLTYIYKQIDKSEFRYYNYYNYIIIINIKRVLDDDKNVNDHDHALLNIQYLMIPINYNKKKTSLICIDNQYGIYGIYRAFL